MIVMQYEVYLLKTFMFPENRLIDPFMFFFYFILMILFMVTSGLEPI